MSDKKTITEELILDIIDNTTKELVGFHRKGSGVLLEAAIRNKVNRCVEKSLHVYASTSNNKECSDKCDPLLDPHHACDKCFCDTERIEEGNVKRSGVAPAPTSPKPDLTPASQTIPEPSWPPTRMIREGCGSFCPDCGSSNPRKYGLFGERQCINKKCKSGK